MATRPVSLILGTLALVAASTPIYFATRPPEPAAPTTSPATPPNGTQHGAPPAAVRSIPAPDSGSSGETVNGVGASQAPEEDAEWKQLRRLDGDSMEYLASQDGSVLASRLFRSRDLNPTDVYLTPGARRALEQIVTRYKESLASLEKGTAVAALKEADILRKEGSLPNTGKVELSDSEKRQVVSAGGLAVKRLKSRRPEASEDEISRARQRGEAEMIMTIKGGVVMLDNGDGTFSIASDKQLETVKAVNKDPSVAFLRLDRAMSIVGWFQRQGALTQLERFGA